MIDCSEFNMANNKNYAVFSNTFLMQDSDEILFNKKLKIVTKRKPTNTQIKALKFASFAKVG